MKRAYEIVLIYTPILSKDDLKDETKKLKALFGKMEFDITLQEDWGLKKLAYPIQKYHSGHYYYTEFEADPAMIRSMEQELSRREKVMRYLTTVLGKYALEYNKKRSEGHFKKAETHEDQGEDKQDRKVDDPPQ